jgi:hypothetical protein
MPVVYTFLLLLLLAGCATTKVTTTNVVPKPLFSDPVFDGAADPVIIWNKAKKEWYMFYTNRRASIIDTTGVKWVHGTRIGIARSADGAHWTYVDTANINYRPVTEYTHWAPEIIEHDGLYHMFLTYVPGVFSDWRHERSIVHLTSKDLKNWNYETTLKLASDRVIDACVYPLPTGGWRLWYNNERDGKSIYYADSKDLYHWEDKGKTFGDRGGEGPKVFSWKNKYWMVVDNWAGLGVYSSDDLTNWKRQKERILEAPGKGTDDGAIGGQADVVVDGDRAFIYYFTHPGRTKVVPAAPKSFAAKRSVIQVAELKLTNGEITCDRDAPTYIHLKAKK